MTQCELSVDRFLASFFGEGNRCKPTAIGEFVQCWIDRLRERPPRPALLPRWDGSGTMFIYGICRSTPERMRLERLLDAYLGRTVLEPFEPRGADRLNAADPVDRVVREWSRNSGFKRRVSAVAVERDEWRAFVQQALQMLAAAETSRAHTQSEIVLPTSTLMRDFRLALEARIFSDAERALHELRSGRRISQANAERLELRLLVVSGRHDEALERFRRPPLSVATDLPARTADDFCIAAAHGVLAKVGSDALSLFAAWRQHLRREGEAWVKHIIEPLSDEARLCRALHAAATDAEDARDLATAAFAGIALDSRWHKAAEAISAHLGPDSEPESVAEVGVRRRAIDGTALLTKLQEALDQNRPDVVVLLAEWLAETETELDAATRERVDVMRRLARRADAADAETEDAGLAPSLPGWTAWLDAIAAPDADVRALRREAAERGDAWSAALARESDSAAFNRLASALERAVLERQSTLADELPLIFGAVIAVRDCEPPASLWSGLLELALLAFEGITLKETHIRVMFELVAAAVPGAPTRTIRAQLQEVTEAITTLMPPAAFGAAVDGLDDVLNEIHSPDEVRPLATALYRFASERRHRLLPDQRDRIEALNSILRHDLIQPEVNLPAPAAEEQATSLEPLRGLRIGLYSLNESALAGAKTEAERLLDGDIHIVTNHDKVSTPALKAMAEGCIGLVIATGCAKHAATESLESHRPAGTMNEYVAGKGRSSLIRGLRALAERARHHQPR